ncbi:fatty acid desaturase family protein [Hyalangium rubrum]|uniref:Fatty acid desaturase n=1 Tax=Hyalangium rubrum TaxID=3103134 RepID=A0ABU5GWV0_9BACT|nr:fatty acid desaturase [Hyalangium sp. s54d21]MDY7225662.1 fatty acid desaturase [Hyalangium sp. s54d21]
MRVVSLPAEALNELQRIDHRHLTRVLLFAVLYLGAAAAVTVLAEQGSGLWSWLARVPLYVLAAASLHGISLFTHEAVHGALARHSGWNRALGAICAWPVLQNFAAYKVLHLKHHADLGGGHDPDHYTNYTPRPWLVFLMNWGRLLLGYPAYITMIPILGWRQGTASDRRWIAFEVASAYLFLGLAIAFLPGAALLHGWVIPMIIINTLVNIRGMSQHTLLPEADHPIRGSRTILTNPVTTFFMCNENYHLEHHLFPRVPWYNLPRLHALLREELIAQGAPFIPSYFAFVRQWVAHSLGRRAPTQGLSAHG